MAPVTRDAVLAVFRGAFADLAGVFAAVAPGGFFAAADDFAAFFAAVFFAPGTRFREPGGGFASGGVTSASYAPSQGL